MFLLDTNVISEVRKGDRCDSNVANWYRQKDPSTMYLSVLVTGEIRRGIEQIRVHDPDQARHFENWLTTIKAEFADRILDVDGKIADEWGRMRAKRPTPVIDCMLAATAKVQGFTLVTRNTKDVEHLGADIFNPFDD